MKVSATDLSNRSGEIIDEALRGPVTVEKRGRAVVAIIDYKHYEYFLELEDKIWAERGIKAAKEAEWMSAKESLEFLRS